MPYTYNLKKFWEAWGQANSLYNSWAASQNVNCYQLFVLYALDGQEAITQKMIADYTGLTKQTVNTVIRSLKNNGYVILTPSEGDRREKQIKLTEKGLAYSKELLTPLYALENKVFNIMGSDRASQMTDAIMLFNTIFEKEMDKNIK